MIESETTTHGDNIVEQINEKDAHGDTRMLTSADVYNILDAIHTNWLDSDVPFPRLRIIGEFMDSLTKRFPDLNDLL